MRKRVLVVLLFFYALNVNAQSFTKDYEIALPDYKVASLYNSVKLIDSRMDTLQMGIVQTGLLNRKALVVSKVPLRTQIKNVLKTLSDSASQNGELVFQLRQLGFAEVTGAMSEKGWCYFKAVIYAKNDERYQQIARVDTVFKQSAVDVTQALFRNGSKIITSFIADALTQKPAGRTYEMVDIIKIDSLEKRELLVYNTDKFADGLYTSYLSFKSQKPDRALSPESAKKTDIYEVKALDDNNLPIKIKPKKAYAIVHNGAPYVATDFGFYPLVKQDDDFYFTGKAKVTANTGNVMMASLFFGVIGGLIASNDNATFEMKIDHVNGGFIHLKELKTD